AKKHFEVRAALQSEGFGRVGRRRARGCSRPTGRGRASRRLFRFSGKAERGLPAVGHGYGHEVAGWKVRSGDGKFKGSCGAAAAAGDELCSEDLGDQASGMVVNSEASPDGGHDLLAVVQTASREGSTVHLKSLAGPVLRFLPLPYAIA